MWLRAVDQHPVTELDADVIGMTAQLIRHLDAPIDEKQHRYLYRNADGRTVGIINQGAKGFKVELWRGNYAVEVGVRATFGGEQMIEFDNVSMSIRYRGDYPVEDLRGNVRTRLRDILSLKDALEYAG